MATAYERGWSSLPNGDLIRLACSTASLPLALRLSGLADITSLEGMFSSCCGQSTIPLLQRASVGSMSSTFSGCYALLHLPPRRKPIWLPLRCGI